MVKVIATVGAETPKRQDPVEMGTNPWIYSYGTGSMMVVDGIVKYVKINTEYSDVSE